MQFYTISVYISIVSVFIPLSVYAFTYKGFPRQNHTVGIFLIASFACDAMAFVFLKIGISPILINNLFDVISFSILSLFYYQLFFRNNLKNLLLAGSIMYGCSLIYFLISRGLLSPQTPLWAINGTITALYGFLYFIIAPKMLLERLLDRNMYSYAVINSSFVFYFLMTILLFLSADYFLQTADMDSKGIFWSAHNIVNILKNIGLAIGLYYTGRRDVKTTLAEIERIGLEIEAKQKQQIKV